MEAPTDGLDTDPKICARVGWLLDIALDLPPDRRAEWLCALPAEDAIHKVRLSSLLAQIPSIESRAFLNTLPKLESDVLKSSGPRAGDIVGSYRLLRELGSGGMGSVWLADRVDGLIKRPVALKLPHGMWRPGLPERMAHEREIVASLNHPHIARLYDAGLTQSGQPFLAFEYVAGKSLDAHCKDLRMSVEARLRLFLQVVAAVSHAHANLIVHRDLKPNNILITADGQARLLDFGIATLLEDRHTRGTNISQLWGRVLTPDYAAPEQIAGEPVTIRSDIYSLGVVLFELITETHPYRSARNSHRALEVAILHEDPPRPRDVVPASRRREIPLDLEAIILKAMKKGSDERYATADALAEDIERYLAGKPVTAQKNAVWYRLSKLIGRHRFIASATALALLVILCATATSLWQRHVALVEARRAQDIKQMLTSVLLGASPYAGEGQARTVLDLLQVVEREIKRVPEAQPALRVELLTIIGTALLNQQDTAGAERVLQQAVDEAKRSLGPKHPLTLRARVLILPVYRFRGRTSLSRQEIESLLPVLRANTAVYAEELVLALKNNAHLDIDEQKYSTAFAAAAEASQVAAERLGIEHHEVVTAQLMLALVSQYHGDPHTALTYARGAKAFAQRRYAENPLHPRIIEAEFLLGRALAGVGRFADAAAQVRIAVNHAVEVFGSSSRKIGFFLVDLARLQLLAGDSRSALESSEQAFAIISHHSDPNSARFATALAMRGRCLLAEHRALEAARDLQQAAGIFEQALGQRSEAAVSARKNLELARMHAQKSVVIAQSP